MEVWSQGENPGPPATRSRMFSNLLGFQRPQKALGGIWRESLERVTAEVMGPLPGHSWTVIP